MYKKWNMDSSKNDMRLKEMYRSHWALNDVHKKEKLKKIDDIREG